MGLLLLIALQLVVSVAGFALLWRRLDRMSGEVSRLQGLLNTRAATQRRRARPDAGALAPVVDDDADAEIVPAVAEGPLTRAARAWSLPARADVHRALRGPTLSPETGRGLILALVATAPAIAFFFNADPSAIVATGITIGAAMMLIALRPMWRAAAWAAVLTAGVWALIGFALAAAHAGPSSYSICLVLGAAAGLAHAHLRRATPGGAMALAMSAAALALGSQIGMVSPAGTAFGAIVAMGAIVGAMSLRLEAMHLAAFGAAVIGIFVLSGQEDAAIWFTPAATWAGALFLAIAAVRVPQLGARGVALAGTGAFAPLGAIAALHAAHHGLADPIAASAAFVGLTVLLGGLISVSALRRDRGLAGLRVTLWVLVLGAFLSASGAIVLALPAQIAAPAFAALGLGLLALDMRLPDTVWRTFALAAGALACAHSVSSAQLLLSEASPWPAWALITSGLALPAALAGGAALVALRSKVAVTSAVFEIVAISLAVASANLLMRLIFSGGATILQPIGFVETGMHCVVWLLAALIIGSRVELGARAVRLTAINVLGLMAFATMAFSAGLWLTAFWKTHADAAAPPLISRDTLGFLLPSILFWAHWVFWRARGANTQTRMALGMGALLLAAFLTVEAVRAEALPDWLSAMVAAVSFALAIVINFAPGVTNAAPRTASKPRGRAPSRPARRATP